MRKANAPGLKHYFVCQHSFTKNCGSLGNPCRGIFFEFYTTFFLQDQGLPSTNRGKP